MYYDDLVVRIEGPRNWPGSLAVNKMAEAMLRAFEKVPGIDIQGPEWVGDGEAAFCVSLEEVFQPEEDMP